MKYYLDTEFIERGYEKIELISIGMVAEDGREFYAVAEDGWQMAHASDWVKENVIPHLGDGCRLPRTHIRHGLVQLVAEDDAPEFWGYYADYDWVLFCQLFGTMMDLPNGFPMFCRDVKQLAVELGNPPLPKETGTAHNALADARHIKEMHEFLMAQDEPRS